MDIFKAIFTRQSIRQFTEESIGDQLCTKLLQAAMQAPSAHNTQPWQFVVIDDREIMRKISCFHPFASMLTHSPLAITVCGDRNIEKSVEYLALNCAAATQNILLAAHGLELGAVWLGIYPRTERMSELSKLLKLPQSIIPISLIAIGHPAEKKTAENRYNKNKIHRNSW
jgi:nitroreductase